VDEHGTSVMRNSDSDVFRWVQVPCCQMHKQNLNV